MVARRAAVAVVASSTLVYATWSLLRWRARKRARQTVDRVMHMLQEGPLIDCESPEVRKRIVENAIRRASKWISLSLSEARQMSGQVGGVSVHKKPLLSLKPDYVLKPLQTDRRGIRELAFYEAIYAATRNQSAVAYATFLRGSDKQKSPVKRFGLILDTVAMAISIFLHDPIVMESEASLREAWKMVKREVDALHRLAKFTPPYYGVVGQRKIVHEAPYGLTEDAHLLLQDVTINFSKPCVIDLKLGTQSYEPDATVEKRTKEYNKYPQQALFGFRIVGMRYYEPANPEADENGYIYIPKTYGRSLSTKEDLLSALGMFFRAGMGDSMFARPRTTSVEDEDLTEEDDDVTEDQRFPTKIASKRQHVGQETSAVANGGVADVHKSDEVSHADQSEMARLPHEVDTMKDEQSVEPESNTNLKPLRVKSVANLMLMLRSLKRWFDENESSLRFYASSLLVVYEGDLSDGCDSGIVTLKMIDFGRVRRCAVLNESTVDEGYRTGIRNLHDLLGALLDEDKNRQRKLRERIGSMSC